ncbi:LuxR C-terminal-related transcriptional regulator [Crocinitomix catalasitica]|uniref:LuxR C-terminal-related transcriptional regulator n=1 Tax=Crocinitomix catalasitica TaxID=184607 RepID=UPI000486D46C|nr:response regulator transcription factor [Crocinitomix catalasitica]
MINLILADDNEITRIGLRTIFKNHDIQIVGEVDNSKALLSQINAFKPEVVLIDYTGPGFSIDVIPQALALHPELKFVAITPQQSGATLIHALKSGVISHIKKDCSVSEIIDSVQETASGQKFFCGQILETIRKEGIDVEEISDAEFSCEPVVLSPREIEVITLIAEGMTNVEISEKLFLSKHTVNTHRKNIMNKLGVKNTAGIVMYAIKERFTTPNKFLFSNEL